ncbi:hypothetical protein Poli38472_000554 [Pythium oligandrum]|uniref:Protein kinase domain-containing protein n=1 Tax=Pythium oligandrum TaxID=41045 RepID=A0A8K1FI79_PYTOL|nr:hypothetical protein Poli38472_000554 [Pythium oligandrum]|eukprot:TMW60512.1 hypothetical protein Poli38472_000554 [Pythium oligandrum]
MNTTTTTTTRLAVSASSLTAIDLIKTPNGYFVDKHTEMTTNKDVSNAALRELDLLLTAKTHRSKALGARHVVGLHSYHLHEKRLHVLQEYCARGDLFDIAQLESRQLRAGLLSSADEGLTTSEHGLKRVFQQTTSAVAFLHAQDIAHLDLSLENVFLTASGDARVGDFAHTQQIQRDPLGRVVPQQVTFSIAKAAYAAPELYSPNEWVDVTQADAWALGVMLWQLVSRTPLFQVFPIPEDPLFQLMQTRGSWWALEQTQRLRGVSWALRDLLHRLLDPNPATRLSVTEAQSHLWFRSCSTRVTGVTSSKKTMDAKSKRLRSQSSGGEISLATTRVAIRTTLR